MGGGPAGALLCRKGQSQAGQGGSRRQDTEAVPEPSLGPEQLRRSRQEASNESKSACPILLSISFPAPPGLDFVHFVHFV